MVDGNDVLAVYEVIKKASEDIRSGKGPVLVEAQTYRYFGHSKSDRNLYRTKEEIEEWRMKDPILRFKKSLVGAGMIKDQKAMALEDEANQRIEGAVAFAEQSPEPDVESLTEFVYA